MPTQRRDEPPTSFNNLIWNYTLSAIPWLIAIAGWIYAANKADSRETRKELRTDIAEISCQIEGINKKIKDFESLNPSTIDAAILRAEILAKMQTLLAKVERFTFAINGKYTTVEACACKNCLDAYYDLAVGDNLERTIDHEKIEAEMHYLEVHSSGVFLEESLRTLFRCKFPTR